MDMEYSTIRYEKPLAGVARIVMSRPQVRNAQDITMTYELRDAFDRAVLDSDVSVVILAGDGAHFSAGHDMQGDSGKTPRDFPLVSTWADFEMPGAEGMFAREREIYLDITERWRNLSKPTIAQVQGRCAAGGIMLAWACDFIVAADDASFVDAVVDIGMPGVEFFAHPYELGVRRAKAFLMLGEPLSAKEAYDCGMVYKLCGIDALEDQVLDLARRLASKPSFAIKQIKEAVNASQDEAGRTGTMRTAFALHQLAHSHNREVFGLPVDPRGLPEPLRSRVFERIERELSPERRAAVRVAFGIESAPAEQ